MPGDTYSVRELANQQGIVPNLVLQGSVEQSGRTATLAAGERPARAPRVLAHNTTAEQYHVDEGVATAVEMSLESDLLLVTF